MKAEEGAPKEKGRFRRVVTHTDFDGVVSAALCSIAEGVDVFSFTGPGSILDMSLGIGPEDIVCDLPHHPAAGLWFDHHAGNLEDYRLKGGDPESLQGAFSEEKSCGRVVYNYYKSRVEFPSFIPETVQEADVIDSFDYKDVEDWRTKTPGKIVSDSMKVSFGTRKERDTYYRHLIRKLRAEPLVRILDDAQVKLRAAQYEKEEVRNLDLMRRIASFSPDDTSGEVVILDTTALKHNPNLIKSLVFVLYPGAKAVLEIKPLFFQNKKTNSLGFSMSLGPLMEVNSAKKDIGEIMRSLNIGDGHRGAGSGKKECRSKEEMLRQKTQITNEILRRWREQG
jgi:oligoribonuclease NrnB/cAMP/cGMP phosphodiesterase (DHH superfamily)